MGYDDASWGAGGWLAMSLMMVILLGLLTGLVLWAVRARSAASNDWSPNASGRANRILAERLARGEIDEIEFERLGSLLNSAGR